MSRTILVTGASKGIGAANSTTSWQGWLLTSFFITIPTVMGAEICLQKDILASGVSGPRMLQFDISKRDETREALVK